jgi:heme exporter protein B
VQGGFLSVSEIWRAIRKDMLVELRDRRSIFVVIAFGVTTTISAGIASGGAVLGTNERALLLWIITFFSAMIALAHSFTREEERGTALLLRISLSPGAVFTAKLVFNIFFFALIQMIITAVFVFFLEGPIASPDFFMMTIFSAGLALSSASTILSAMAAKSAMKGALFPVISLPVLLPVLIGAIRATALCFDQRIVAVPSEIVFFLAFSGALISISFLIFPHIWNNE